jgi:hypothetical protein
MRDVIMEMRDLHVSVLHAGTSQLCVPQVVGCLLESVQRLIQAANQIRLSWIGEARRLTTEESLTEPPQK